LLTEQDTGILLYIRITIHHVQVHCPLVGNAEKIVEVQKCDLQDALLVLVLYLSGVKEEVIKRVLAPYCSLYNQIDQPF
jgi:hypothetical protein